NLLDHARLPRVRLLTVSRPFSSTALAPAWSSAGAWLTARFPLARKVQQSTDCRPTGGRQGEDCHPRDPRLPGWPARRPLDTGRRGRIYPRVPQGKEAGERQAAQEGTEARPLRCRQGSADPCDDQRRPEPEDENCAAGEAGPFGDPVRAAVANA